MNTSCQSCSALYRPNENRSACLPMIPTSVKPSDPAGIAICVVSIMGIISVFVIVLAVYRYGNGTLSYVILFGIFLGYVTAPLALLERTATSCSILFFTFSISLCIIVAALFIKTNRIYRVFSKSTTKKGTAHSSSFFLCRVPIHRIRNLSVAQLVSERPSELTDDSSVCFNLTEASVNVKRSRQREVKIAPFHNIKSDTD